MYRCIVQFTIFSHVTASKCSCIIWTLLWPQEQDSVKNLFLLPIGFAARGALLMQLRFIGSQHHV